MSENPAMLFRVAAGPQIGFGHLIRVVSLSRVTGERPLVSLRGGDRARATARRLGCVLTEKPPALALVDHRPEVLVVDDPRASAAQAWVCAARRRGVPVAAIADRGHGAHGTDLLIDGGLRPPVRRSGSPSLLGPKYMVLDPTFLQARRRRRRISSGTVAIALGGGAHASYATGVAAELTARLGSERIRFAPGFTRTGHSFSPRWRSQADFFADAEVALVGGGVGLYEACCLGVPTVAVAVTPAQREAIRAFARAGAVVDAGMLLDPDQPCAGRLATRVRRLLGDPRRRARLSKNARRMVDGRGGLRVAAALRQLTRTHSERGGGASR